MHHGLQYGATDGAGLVRDSGGIGALAALVAGCAAFALRQAVATRQPAFPGAHWSWKAPEEAGFSMHALQDFSRRAGGTGCLVHGGRMTQVWDAGATHADSGKAIALFRCTQMILYPR